MTGRAAMTYLFSNEGLAALDAFADAETLFAFDLDGTLAPIVSDPDGIRVSPAVQAALLEMTSRAVVAIITGRSRRDAQHHLGVVPQYLIGNHGAEGLPGYDAYEGDFRHLGSRWEMQLQKLIPRDAGIVIENKGLSLSVHYRGATDRAAARSLVRKVVGQLVPPPRTVGGKYVESLLPEEAPDKGTAFLQLMNQAGCAKGLFVGDDQTDEDVFELNWTQLFTIRVGTGKGSRARYFVRDQHEVPVLLGHINDALARRKP